MESKVKLVVFDMAGTTVDEQNVVYKTLQKAINLGGISVSLEDVLKSGAGKEKKTAIIDIAAIHAPGVTSEKIEMIFVSFLNELELAYQALEVIPIAGAEKLFDILKSKGIKIVLNTGYNRETAEKLLAKLSWTIGQQIDNLVTASDVKNARPMPDMVYNAMELTGITDAASVLKIGDSGIDIEEGKNAGCGLTVGITTGAQTREQIALAKPDYIIDSLLELPSLLN